ncbi:MAG: hypothetical protein OEV78_10800 [Spirochaetia bacterium]|nr:hypothetical protein [Spirochaetia bacterium]
MFISIKNVLYDLFHRDSIKGLNLYSTITCPNCGYQNKEHMPVNACVLDYICLNCKTVMHAKEGHCCIFCSYGDVDCPGVQIEKRNENRF